MKYHLQQSGGQAIDWIYKDFRKARRNLILVYLLIILGVVSLFSLILIKQVKSPFEQKSILTDEAIVLTVDEALTKANALMPEREVVETEYEFENGALIFTIMYTNNEEVKANFFTGEVYIEDEEEISLVQRFTDDFDEIVIWVGFVVFLVASLGAVYVANKTLAPIAKSIRKQKEFVSGAAHELRNPLAAIHTSLEGALRLGETNTRATLEDLLSETKRLIVTSESLLDIERHESKKKNIESQNMDESLSSILTRLKQKIEEKNISIIKDIEGVPLSVDRKDLETLLYNLIHNAVKFSNNRDTITIRWKNDTLSINDTGIGISPEHLPHIFNRFYKVDSARAFENGGNGLGLSLVQDIVASYGGTIKVESNMNQGTKFTVIF